MLNVMETDLSTTVDGVVQGESIFPSEEYNYTNATEFVMRRRDSLYVVIPMTILYVVIFIAGLLGNVVTFIVIVKNKYMHTATNYYLFSLAISDLLLLVTGLPQEMVFIWCRYPYLFGEVFCILRGLSAETSTNASILTITAFTVERYVAICHPFLSQTMSKLSRAVKLIVVIWLVALSFAIPQAIQFGVLKVGGDPNRAMCTVKRNIIDHSFELSSLLFFIAPMTLITILYCLIGIKLRKSNMMKRNGGSFYNNCQNRSSQSRKNLPPHHQSSRRVLKMLVAVVVAFFICWAPFHVQRLVYTYGESKDKSEKAVMSQIFDIITYISGILYYVSTAINPILYHIMSLKFREAFKDTIARCTGLSAFKDGGRRRSYSILHRYNTRGTLSRGSSHTYDTDHSSNYIREDALPENGLNYVVTSSYPTRYNNKRKKVSLTEITDDSIKTEMTQIQPCRGNSQNQFAVVVELGKTKLQERAGREEFWKSDAIHNGGKFWKVFKCIRADSPTEKIKSEYSFRSPGLHNAKTDFPTTETGNGHVKTETED